MSDTEVQNFTATGSGKSEAEVAFELLNKLKGQGVWGERNVSAILDMYAECLDATKGLRAYEGQNRVDVPIKAPAAKPAAAPQQRAPQQQTAPQAQPQAQMAPTPQPVAQASTGQQPAAQPVHAQQQALQQAYKPA